MRAMAGSDYYYISKIFHDRLVTSRDRVKPALPLVFKNDKNLK